MTNPQRWDIAGALSLPARSYSSYDRQEQCVVWDMLQFCDTLERNAGSSKIQDHKEGKVIQFFDHLEEDWTNLKEPGKLPFDMAMQIDHFDIQIGMITDRGPHFVDQFYKYALFQYCIPGNNKKSPLFPLSSLPVLFKRQTDTILNLNLRYEVSRAEKPQRFAELWTPDLQLFPQIFLRGSKEEQNCIIQECTTFRFFEITILAVGRKFL